MDQAFHSKHCPFLRKPEHAAGAIKEEDQSCPKLKESEPWFSALKRLIDDSVCVCVGGVDKKENEKSKKFISYHIMKAILLAW